MATDPETVPGLLDALWQAITEPETVTPRGRTQHHVEPADRWAVRAAAIAVGPFLAKPVDLKARGIEAARHLASLTDQEFMEALIFVEYKTPGFTERLRSALLGQRGGQAVQR